MIPSALITKFLNRKYGSINRAKYKNTFRDKHISRINTLDIPDEEY